MNFFKVGIVDFFGILCPGALLLMNLVLLLIACQIDFIKSIDLAYLEKFNISIFIFLFVLCYLFGSILRLISPDIIDKISTIFMRIIFRMSYSLKRQEKKKFKIAHTKLNKADLKKKFEQYLKSGYYDNIIKNNEPLPKFFLADEQYPYYYSWNYILNIYLPPTIKKKLDLKKYHNSNYLNYWKTFVVKKDPTLATHVFQAEALVRFISGAFWALVIGIVAGLVLIISNFIIGGDMRFGVFFTSLSLIMSIVILLRFKNQRRREVFILLTAISAIK